MSKIKSQKIKRFVELRKKKSGALLLVLFCLSIVGFSAQSKIKVKSLGAMSVTLPAQGTDGSFNIDLQADKYIIQGGNSVNLTASAYPAREYEYDDDACDGLITIVGWHDFNGLYTACAIDECHTIYRLELFNLTDDSHFAIIENEAEVHLNLAEDVKLTLEPNSEGDPGYRNTGGSGDFTYYLNMNTTPYSLSAAEPAVPTGPAVKIVPEEGTTEINKCDSITLNATVCPDDGTISYTYQWFRDDIAIPGTTGPVLKDSVEHNNTEYYVWAIPNGNIEKAISSNKLIITFFPSPKLDSEIDGPNGFALNQYEHEITLEEFVTIRTSDINIYEYTLQYRSLVVGSLYRDTVIEGYPVDTGTEIEFTFAPTTGAEYRLKAVDEGGCTERYSDPYLVRVIFNCENQNDNQEPEILFIEDFGSFTDANTFVKDKVTYVGNVNGVTLSDFWAPDPDNHVQNHLFAGDHIESGCPNRRISDGYYAIVTNPASSNCLNSGSDDYWDGPDHTGNLNGGMLFVNCNDDPNTVIYERAIHVNGCEGVKVLFSAFISNASIKRDAPVNVRLDVWNSDKTRLIHSISSGDVLKRNPGDPNKWANLSFKFDAGNENTTYVLQLTNNNPGGNNCGNEIIIDDISVMLCYPTINLRTVNGQLNVNSCGGPDTIVALKAFEENGVDEYFQNPYFTYQYRNESTNYQWIDFKDIYDKSIVRVDTIDIHLDETFLGMTDVRLIVASSPSTIDKIRETRPGEEFPPLSCEDFYAIDSTFKINVKFFIPEPINTVICPGEIVPLPHVPTTEDFEWYLYLLNDDGTRDLVKSGVQNDLEEKYSAYFANLGDTDVDERIEYMFAVETDKCLYDEDTGTPIVIVRLPSVEIQHTIAGGLTIDPITAKYVICENDNTGTITASTNFTQPYEWVWTINGDTLKVNDIPYNNAVLNMQTIIAETGIYEGEIELSTSRYCTESHIIPFKIYRMFELALDATVQPDGGSRLCLQEGVENEILLTATTINSADGSPSTYYWYIYQNGVPVELASTDVPEYLYRDTDGRLNANAQYIFEVRATDGVCRKTVSDAAWAPSNRDNIEVRLPVEFVSLKAENEDPISADTQDIKYTLTVKNPRAGMVIVWGVNGVEKGTITMQEGKTEYDFYPPLVMVNNTVSVYIENDDYCMIPDTLSVPYKVSYTEMPEVMITSGVVYDAASNRYVVDCGMNHVNIAIQTLYSNSKVIYNGVEGNHFTVDINRPGIYTIPYTVRTGDGQQSDYTISLEKRFEFNDIIVQKWNNVLLVNNNPENNGGYSFTAFTWFRDGVSIGTDSYYSAGNNITDRLDPNALYSVTLTTSEGETLRTCESSPDIQKSGVFVSSNLVEGGQTINVEIRLPSGTFGKILLELTDSKGLRLQRQEIKTPVSRVKMPSVSGTYFLRAFSGNFEQTIKVMVK